MRALAKVTDGHTGDVPYRRKWPLTFFLTYLTLRFISNRECTRKKTENWTFLYTNKFHCQVFCIHKLLIIMYTIWHSSSKWFNQFDCRTSFSKTQPGEIISEIKPFEKIQTQINIWIMKELMPYRLKLFYRNWVSPDRNWPTNRYSDWPWYSGCIKLGQKGHWSVDQTRFLKSDNLVSYLYV